LSCAEKEFAAITRHKIAFRSKTRANRGSMPIYLSLYSNVSFGGKMP
jgi:hypothetical protein